MDCRWKVAINLNSSNRIRCEQFHHWRAAAWNRRRYWVVFFFKKLCTVCQINRQHIPKIKELFDLWKETIWHGWFNILYRNDTDKYIVEYQYWTKLHMHFLPQRSFIKLIYRSERLGLTWYREKSTFLKIIWNVEMYAKRE